MTGDTVSLASIFANVRVFPASAPLAKKYAIEAPQVAENRAIMERLKSLPR